MATVNFNTGEWNDFLLENDVQHSDDLSRPPFYAAMESANARRAEDVMQQINKLVDASGVEAIRMEGVHVDNYHGDIIATYVNMGDTYALTLVYDTANNAFFLESYGDWLEQWETEHPRTENCAICNREYPIDELNAGAICRRCENAVVTTWEYGGYWGSPALVTTLRSVEGDAIAVHLWNTSDDKVELAFSVPVGKGTFSAKQIKGRTRKDPGPYTYSWEELTKYMREDHHFPVAYTTRDVTLNQEQFQRLNVALEAFFERGEEAHPAFVPAPPVLFTCDEVNSIDWHEERGEAHVAAYVVDYEQHRQGHLTDKTEVWSAQSPELEELVEDGFIKWGDDNSVREYLKQLGVCR